MDTGEVVKLHAAGHETEGARRQRTLCLPRLQRADLPRPREEGVLRGMSPRVDHHGVVRAGHVAERNSAALCP